MQTFSVAQERSQAATSECNKMYSSMEIFKSVVAEVYSRAQQGDKTSLDILKKVMEASA